MVYAVKKQRLDSSLSYKNINISVQVLWQKQTPTGVQNTKAERFTQGITQMAIASYIYILLLYRKFIKFS